MGSAGSKATCGGKGNEQSVLGPVEKVSKIFTGEFTRAGEKTEKVDIGNITKGLGGVTDGAASYYMDQGYHFCSAPTRDGYKWRPAETPTTSPSPSPSPSPDPSPSPTPSGH